VFVIGERDPIVNTGSAGLLLATVQGLVASCTHLLTGTQDTFRPPLCVGTWPFAALHAYGTPEGVAWARTRLPKSEPEHQTQEVKR
jgi:hypothetical protein